MTNDDDCGNVHDCEYLDIDSEMVTVTDASTLVTENEGTSKLNVTCPVPLA